MPRPVRESNGTEWKSKQKTYLKLLNEERRYHGLGEYKLDFLKEDNNK
jgi:hypothetical protein